MNIISENVWKTYKIKKGIIKTYDIKVVEGFNYSIKQGEIIGILGEEGSGKSTVINLLSGNVIPSEGRILVNGEENYRRLKKYCGIISEFTKKNLKVNETVYNNFIVFAKKYKLDLLGVEKNISIYREMFEMDNIINKKICDLSILELVKVNITMYMLRNIPVLFFDSALSNLSVVEKNIVLKMLKRLNKEFKTTIVVSSNDLADVEKICKRITIINKGRIVKDCSYEELKKDLGNKKEIQIIFNKQAVIPKGNLEILEQNDYLIRVRVDFDKYDFATLISQFDINTIIDITISNVYLA